MGGAPMLVLWGAAFGTLALFAGQSSCEPTSASTQHSLSANADPAPAPLDWSVVPAPALSSNLISQDPNPAVPGSEFSLPTLSPVSANDGGNGQASNSVASNVMDPMAPTWSNVPATDSNKADYTLSQQLKPAHPSSGISVTEAAPVSENADETIRTIGQAPGAATNSPSAKVPLQALSQDVKPMEPPAEDKEQKNIESNNKDGTAAPRQDAPFSCEGKGRLLVVLAGLMRDYDKTWPKVQRSLQMDKWEACKVGMPMVIVDTDLSNPCSEKDIKAKRCDEGRLTGQALENDYKKTIGRWYGETISDDSTSWHRFASVVKDLYDHGQLDKFSHFVLLRPDVFLTPKIRSDEITSLDVGEVCKKNPGFNIISGKPVAGMDFHDRDYDYGYMTDRADLLATFFLGLEMGLGNCAHDWAGCKAETPQPPPKPADLKGKWTGGICKLPQCNKAMWFHDLNERLGTIDNDSFAQIENREWA